MGGQQEGTCPICMEEMDLTDQELQPCVCGYEICLWCWHIIIQTAKKDGSDARCPECCNPYDKDKILKRTINKERLATVNTNKKITPQKTKQKVSDVGKDICNLRVIRRNIVYIAGIPKNLSDEKTLMKKEYFGQYGKIIKIFFTQTDGSRQYSSDSCIVYVNFSKEEEALRCIQVVNGYLLNGSPLKASFGTTRYCYSWLKNLPCKNPECLYIHEVVPEEDICKREEVIPFCTSKLQQCSGLAHTNLKQHSGSFLPPPLDTKNSLPPLVLNRSNRYIQSDSFGRSYASVAASSNQSKLPSMDGVPVIPSGSDEVYLPANAWDYEHACNEVPTRRDEMPLLKHDMENFALAKPSVGTSHSKISCLTNYKTAANSNLVAEDTTCRMSLPDGNMSEGIIGEPFFSDSDVCSQLSTSPANVTTLTSDCSLSSNADKWRCETGECIANAFSSRWDDLVSVSTKHKPFLSSQALSGHSTSTQQNFFPSYDWSRSRSGSDLGPGKFSCGLEDESLSTPNIKSRGFSTFPTINADFYHKQNKPSASFSTGSRLFHGEQKKLCIRSSSYNSSDFDFSQVDKTRMEKFLNESYTDQCEDNILADILALDLDADDPIDTHSVIELGSSDDLLKTSNPWISSTGDSFKSYFSMMDGYAANEQLSPWSNSTSGQGKNSSCHPDIMLRTKAYMDKSKNSNVLDRTLLSSNEAVADSQISLDMHRSGYSLSRATQRTTLSTPPGFPPLKTYQGTTNQSEQHNSSSARFSSSISARKNNSLTELGATDSAKVTSLNASKSSNLVSFIRGDEENSTNLRHLFMPHLSNCPESWEEHEFVRPGGVDYGVIGRNQPKLADNSSVVPELQHEYHSSYF